MVKFSETTLPIIERLPFRIRSSAYRNLTESDRSASIVAVRIDPDREKEPVGVGAIGTDEVLGELPGDAVAAGIVRDGLKQHAVGYAYPTSLDDGHGITYYSRLVGSACYQV